MSDDMVIRHMIDFVEKQEKQLQLDKLLNDNKAKNDVVNTVILELTQVMKHENTKN